MRTIGRTLTISGASGFRRMESMCYPARGTFNSPSGPPKASPEATDIALRTGMHRKRRVAISPSGELALVLTEGEHDLRLIDLRTRRTLCRMFGGGGGEWAIATSFLPDEQHAIAVDSDKVVLWELQTGQSVWRIDRSNNEHRPAALAVSHDGQFAAVAFPPNDLSLIRIADGEIIRTIPGSSPCLGPRTSILVDSRRTDAGSLRGTVRMSSESMPRDLCGRQSWAMATEIL